jgi:plastocyanin
LVARTAALLVAAVALAAAFAGPARAADARVAIGHYRWSTPVVHIDLGQHVTWYWVGPDTMHSVTGDSPNDLGIDSDPGNPEPMHKVGFTFTVVFTQPGVYQFHCKLHNIVHGEVIVSDTPGNPSDDPDPIPQPNVNLSRPSISSIHLSPPRFGTRGTTLDYALDDISSIDAEIWHLSDGRRGTYAGWQELHGHIGLNYGPFAQRGPHFRPAPGRYVAFLTPTDIFHNLGRTQRLEFTIRPARRRVGHHHRTNSAPSTVQRRATAGSSSQPRATAESWFCGPRSCIDPTGPAQPSPRSWRSPSSSMSTFSLKKQTRSLIRRTSS